jgi:amidase
MADDLARLDAIDQAELVRSGQMSPAELVDAAIDRLERLDSGLNAVIHPALELARERARSADLEDGPFHGVPMLMKDIGGEEAGRPVHAGLGFAKRAGYTAPEDSYLTRRFKAAGLVSLGRTNTPELALLPTTEPEAYGPTRNPWNRDHSSGGSSGGASAAVAAGIVPVAHASDGGGSIRGPASMCSLVGLKPTRGRSSFGPGLGERWSGLSCEFVVSRTVRDSAALLDVVAGPMPGDPYFAAPPERSFYSATREERGPLRIGFRTAPPGGMALHPEIRKAVERCAQRLVDLGHRVEEAHPAALDDPETTIHYVTIVAGNVARALDAWAEKIGAPVTQDDAEPLTWELAERGRELPAPRFLATLEYVHRFGRRLAEWWEGGFDLLLTPTQAMPPVRIGTLGSTREQPLAGFLRCAPYGVFTLPYNLSGQPAISLPGGFTEGDDEWPRGLPLGVQLVARFGGERTLLGVAAALEEAAPWTDETPPQFG